MLKQTCSTSRYLGRMNGLFLVERLVNRYGATFAYLEGPLGRLKSIELTGEPELTATTFVGGLKHLPVRYSLD